MKRFAVIAAVTTALGFAAASQADTLAYWKFEGTPGADVPHATAAGTFDGTVPDASGNNNSLSVWTTGWAGYAYNASVPAVGGSTSSVKNTGGNPAMMTIDNAGNSGGGVNGLNTAAFPAFTVEASYKPETGGWRTLIGRDAIGVVSPGNGSLSALYLQLTPQNAIAFKFADVGGVWHEVQTVDGFADPYDFQWSSDPDGNTGAWMNIAATSDGSTMKIYCNGVTVAQTSIAGSSSNTALTAGIDPGGSASDDWYSGGWSIGRGLYNGDHGDRAYGFIDEVRISNVALAPSQLLVPAPEPTTLSVGLAAIGFFSRRRRA